MTIRHSLASRTLDFPGESFGYPLSQAPRARRNPLIAASIGNLV